MSCGRCLEVCGTMEEVIDAPPALDPVWMHEARRDDIPPTYSTMPGDYDGNVKAPVVPPRPSMHSVESDAFPHEPEVEFGVDNTDQEKTRKPKTHRHRMDELEVLDKAWWCYYCLCGGCGATEDPASCHLISKCCCCRETCEYVDASAVNNEGACSFVHTCCTCVSLCQWPFREGTPVCMLCSAQFCGWHGKTRSGAQKPKKQDNRRVSETDGEVPPSPFDHVLHDTCVLCYCFGCGLACAGTILEIYDSFTKCCCCRCTLGLSSPCAEDGCCAHLINCGRYHSQCRCPIKKESNPMLACCGTRLRKVHPHGRNIGVGVAGKPKQQEMR